ncbi:RNA 2',3'-cyclic phosphodiesterase [Pseudomonas lopnurensis]|uniref:RNA 2',3'-cyclic phosphodiesterase n=1 Tax=Pseudomonas lopnurensis TaxID=1477517 RepID=UPI0018795EA5|nr:RNA 2',3'-cyclic phosphodiesterase [Pseudomonas lopnurensis]MBE7376412.1 RNA 2',3'-cyclic phosphodiesterase [Pseudomonas lopnurensis]
MSEGTLRLFFALPCPTEQAAAICTWRDERALDGRPVSRANLHLTLAFLGAQPVDRLEALLALGAAVQCPAFQLTLDRLTTIGKGFVCLRPSETPAALEYLVATLNERLAAQGVVLDSRPFLPHLTLTRQARNRPHGPAPAFSWRAEHFVLYLSQNTPDGARYVEKGRWPLQAPKATT